VRTVDRVVERFALVEAAPGPEPLALRGLSNASREQELVAVLDDQFHARLWHERDELGERLVGDPPVDSLHTGERADG
jgi:hypothetical protein